MVIEIVDLPIENGGSFHSYVKLPVNKYNVEGSMLPNGLFAFGCNKENEPIAQ